MQSYIKYNNLDFEKFSIDRIMESMEDSQGFILCSVFQKKFSLDVNLKRHEDMKNWIYSKGLNFIVLDGIQKVIDREEDRIYDYSILYILVFFDPIKIDPIDFSDLGQIILKRYDLKSMVIKLPQSNDLETWNRELEKKAIKNLTSTSMYKLVENFFAGINKRKDKFYFLGIEKKTSFKNKSGFYQPIEKRNRYQQRAIA